MNAHDGKLSVGKVIHDGLAFDPKNWSQSEIDPDTMPKTVKALFDLLESRSIDYVLVGGVALLAYIKGRNTSNIDLIMAVSSLEKIPEIKVTEQEENFARGNYDGLQLDLLFTKNPLFKSVSQKYINQQSFLERTTNIASVEGLLLLKLYTLPSWYQQGDFARVGIYENDIATLIYEFKPDIPGLKEILTGYLDSNDIVEINKILEEIQTRTERFRKRSS